MYILRMIKIRDNLFYELQMQQIFTFEIVVLNATIILLAIIACNRIFQFFTMPTIFFKSRGTKDILVVELAPKLPPP